MIKQLVLTNGNKETIIQYKTLSYKSTSVITLLIDIIVLIFFDWWIWLPVWIFTTIFNIRKIEEIENVRMNVYLLLNQNWMPKDEFSRELLIKDFGINENLIAVKQEI